MASRRGHGEGSIFQPAEDGKWLAVLEIGREPSTGKRVRRTITATTRREAAQRLRALRDQLDRSAVNVDGRATIAQWSERWLEHVHYRRDVTGDLRPNTAASYERLTRIHVVGPPGRGPTLTADAGPRRARLPGDARRRARALGEDRAGTQPEDRSLGPPKSERGIRDVPAPDRLQQLLRSHRVLVAQRRLAAATWIDTDAFFPTQRGTYPSIRNVQRRFRGVVRTLELSPGPDPERQCELHCSAM